MAIEDGRLPDGPHDREDVVDLLRDGARCAAEFGVGLEVQPVLAAVQPDDPETALRLLDEVGLDGLTVRRLAAELGVQSPSLYWHIGTKQELLDGMADTIVQAAGMGPPRDGESWQDWLTRRARAYRQSLLAHRDGARIVAAAAALSPATVRTFDQELTAMVGWGFTPVFALRAIAALTRYVTGFVLQEQTERQGDTAPPADQLATLAELLDGGTSATLLVAIREGGSPLSEEAFEYGLRALIDGAAIALAHQRRAARSLPPN